MSGSSATVDVDALPPTQYLILEVLAARHRTGEQVWTFPNRPAIVAAADQLANLGLIGWKSGPAPRTVLAWLTEAGRASALDDTYRTPEPGTWPERIARYLERAADSRDATGLLADKVSANTLREAADWCRDDAIWNGSSTATNK